MSSQINRIEIREDAYGVRVYRRWPSPPLARALGIDPPTEVTAQRLAAAHDLAPSVFDFDVAAGELCMAFVAGRPLAADWARSPACIALLRQTIKKLRGIEAVGLPGIDLPARLSALHARLETVNPTAALACADRLRECLEAWHCSGAASAVSAATSVLVHGDLGPGNVIVRADGTACLLDWEYAHRGHPDEDLAGLVAQLTADERLAAGLSQESVEPHSFAARVGLRRMLDDVWRALASHLRLRASAASV